MLAKKQREVTRSVAIQILGRTLRNGMRSKERPMRRVGKKSRDGRTVDRGFGRVGKRGSLMDSGLRLTRLKLMEPPLPAWCNSPCLEDDRGIESRPDVEPCIRERSIMAEPLVALNGQKPAANRRVRDGESTIGAGYGDPIGVVVPAEELIEGMPGHSFPRECVDHSTPNRSRSLLAPQRITKLAQSHFLGAVARRTL